MAARFHKDRGGVVHSIDTGGPAHLAWSHCGIAFRNDEAYEMRDGRAEEVTCRFCLAEVKRRLCSERGRT